jgi:hypothetical protein
MVSHHGQATSLVYSLILGSSSRISIFFKQTSIRLGRFARYLFQLAELDQTV